MANQNLDENTKYGYMISPKSCSNEHMLISCTPPFTLTTRSLHIQMNRPFLHTNRLLRTTVIGQGGRGGHSVRTRCVKSDEFELEPILRPSASWPQRYTIVGLCFVSFMLCNLDRVNMSIAILPMAASFSWTSLDMGLVHSSFFVGYLSTQILGGVLAIKYGGKQVLGTAVLFWSLATCLTPWAASCGLPTLLFARMIMGIGEGMAMPSMNQILSKWIGAEERSRSLSFVYSGMFLGSILGLSLSPVMIETLGWPSVFIAFGSLGPFWWIAWQILAKSSPSDTLPLDKGQQQLSAPEEGSKASSLTEEIPWAALLSRSEVWAIIVSHFCHNYATFLLLSFMPTFFSSHYGLDLTLRLGFRVWELTKV